MELFDRNQFKDKKGIPITCKGPSFVARALSFQSANMHHELSDSPTVLSSDNTRRSVRNVQYAVGTVGTVGICRGHYTAVELRYQGNCGPISNRRLSIRWGLQVSL
jgi:hypothetical protein